MNKSIQHGFIKPQAGRLMLTAADCENYDELSRIGIQLPNGLVAKMSDALYAMDDTTALVTTASIATPIQFLQTWLPGQVRILTQARKIDELIGVSIVGQWEDEEIVQGLLEPTGKAVLYGDITNIPLASWNWQAERRTVVRFEQGFRVGMLEEARAGRMKINTAAEKRGSVNMSLDIQRNVIGFYGFNGGANRTYGFLNDPSLPAYVTAPNGAAGTPTWATKIYLEICADIRGLASRLRTATGDQFDPQTQAWTLGLATAVVEYLGVVSQYGNSVSQWLKETYPKVRVVSAPELTAANGGANVAYAYPDRIDDGSTDDGRVWAQLVPVKSRILGVEKGAKGYVEDYTNATAGVMAKRPFAIQRLTGI